MITRPETYTGISLDERSVILKVHGAVDRHERRSFNDSYVISEDHYIDFLATTRLETLAPDAYDPYWRITLQFLDIIAQHWPKHLAEKGLLDASDRQARLIAAEAARLRLSSSMP